MVTSILILALSLYGEQSTICSCVACAISSVTSRVTVEIQISECRVGTYLDTGLKSRTC